MGMIFISKQSGGEINYYYREEEKNYIRRGRSFQRKEN